MKNITIITIIIKHNNNNNKIVSVHCSDSWSFHFSFSNDFIQWDDDQERKKPICIKLRGLPTVNLHYT